MAIKRKRKELIKNGNHILAGPKECRTPEEISIEHRLVAMTYVERRYNHD